MISYRDLLILKLSGMPETYNEREFIIPNEMVKCGLYDKKGFFTCEFLVNSKYIIRCYLENGVKWGEIELESVYGGY